MANLWVNSGEIPNNGVDDDDNGYVDDYRGWDFSDDDNDAVYFTEGSHQLIDSVIGWAKDDGIDAGSGGTGQVVVDGSWFEACFHEGQAWSGGGRGSRCRRAYRATDCS